ncbi:substrate-binding periplasmic protein [Parasulfitobacter algicola]|uniref:Transporter substrate-binding domain-containing protein n=1 Tax=Parasulfitobacter algicola TaxID=2614809 RepID=A0ABX2IQF5_9RHOB|nr:transporter substrate-binding domain-containing protein [Sulfitobacter algicola]NSX54780.1 transporter substrate-binding domain-containing protein [Sulfitobacter algicola]
MFKIIITTALIALGATAVSAKETLRAVTADTLSPFTRSADEDLPGFNYEFMTAVAEEAGYELEIEFLPWKRAQAVVAEEPGLLIFGATRNAAREDKYDWVTNLITVSRTFLTIGEPVNSMDQAKELKTISARSVYKRSLVKAGFTNVEESGTHSNFKKLKAGRTDAVFTVSARAVFVWSNELSFDSAELTLGDEIGRSDIWLAASKGYDRDVIQALHAASERLKADGTYAALYKRYFGDLPIYDMANPTQAPTSGSS